MKKILIVEDDIDLREILIECLEAKGYKTLGATNGFEALKMIELQKIDAVLSDLQMPGMDGAELLRAINRRAETIPMILFISGASNLSLEEAYDLGAAAILSKPFPRQVLIDTVEKLFLDHTEKWRARPPRHPSAVEIELRFHGIEQAKKAHLFNIGRGGAYIRTQNLFPKLDTQIFFNILFDLTENVTLSGIGVVRWIRTQDQGELPSGFGIEFIFLDEPGRSQFRSILNHLSNRHFIPIS